MSSPISRFISFRQMVLIAVAAALGVLLMRPAAAQTSNSVFYVDPNTQAARWVALNQSDSRMPVIRDRIASVPQGRWFTQNNTPTVAAQVSSYVGAAAAAGKIPIMIVYNIPNRDCGGLSSGGIRTTARTAPGSTRWQPACRTVRRLIILEPDVLPIMSSCLSAAQQAETRASIAYAGKRLKAGSSQARVYFDIGHSNWLSPSEAASRLVASDIANSADGISTNVSNYRTTSAEISYAKQIIAATGISRLQAVIDTSRNGNGPLGSEWCDPSGRAIGTPSTNVTGDAKIDAFVWVKPPGEADGCIAAAGQFVAQRAYDLAIAAGPVTPPTDTQPPSVPGAPSVTVTASSVTLSWAGSSDNVGVSGYDIFRAPGSSGGTFTSVGSVVSDHVHELGPGFEHDVPVSGAGARRGRQYVGLYRAGGRHDLRQQRGHAVADRARHADRLGHHRVIGQPVLVALVGQCRSDGVRHLPGHGRERRHLRVGRHLANRVVCQHRFDRQHYLPLPGPRSRRGGQRVRILRSGHRDDRERRRRRRWLRGDAHRPEPMEQRLRHSTGPRHQHRHLQHLRLDRHVHPPAGTHHHGLVECDVDHQRADRNRARRRA